SWLLRLPASGGDARRGAGSRSTQSLLHLREELLKQPEQLERRAVPAIAHERRGDVFLPVDFPAPDGRPPQAGVALRTLGPALSLLAGSAALALARQQLPAGTRAETRCIFARDEAAAVESDNVKTVIFCGLVECAAHGEAVAG